MSKTESFPLTDEVERSLRSRLCQSAAELPGLCPVDDVIRRLDGQEHLGDYGRIPPEVAGLWRRIEERWGAGVLEDYRKLLLVELIRTFEERGGARSYPDSIRALFARCFRRIISQLDRQPAGFYRHGNDDFDKDLAVCRHKLIPCGPQYVDRMAGIPRGQVLSGGWRQALSLLRFALFRLGGFRPLYEMHMENRMLLEFTRKGWERSYRRMAELLVRHSDVLGVFGTSWWFAPEIREISPQLAYLRALPEENGARLFSLGESEAAVRDATTNSKTRKELHEQGKYQPMNYLMIWRRQDLIRWAVEAGEQPAGGGE